MTIAPVIHSVQVPADPARAFHLFATRIGDWWPRGQTVAAAAHTAIVIEPRQGGRWFERDADGQETQWGHVLEWQPPGRMLLAWQLNAAWRFDPAFLTEVELRFEPRDGGTLVTLEHRNLERFGADAEAHAGKLRGGWPARMADFAAYATAHTP